MLRDPSPETVVLDNGLRILLLPTRALTVGIAIGVGVGSCHEDPAQAGIAHAVEHCVFRGTRRRDSFAICADLERAGGVMNAWTSEETTVYHASMPARGWRAGLEVLADVVSEPTFPPDGVERERGVLLEEVCSVEDDPEELAWANAFRSLYGGHPAGREVIGSSASVRSLSPEDLARFHRDRYAPDATVLAVAGRFPRAAVLGAARSLLGGLDGRARRSPVPPQPPPPRGLEVSASREVTQAHLVLAYPFPPAGPLVPAARCALAILTGRDVSRVRWEVRERRGLAYAVDGEYGFGSGWGHLGVYAAPDAGRAAEVEGVVVRELCRLADGELEASELEEVKAWLSAQLLREQESPADLAVHLVEDELVLGPGVFARSLSSLVAVEAEEVAAVADRHLREPSAVSTVVPARRACETFL